MNGDDFDPNSTHDWIGVLHKAAKALHDNPKDAEALEWVNRAKQNIDDLQQVQNRRDVLESQDIGKGGAFALGAARGMSFGLSDVAQKLALSPEEQQSVSTTASEHPGYTKAGTIAGAAIPFLAGSPLGANAIGARTAIGAAQGFGLTRGNVMDRSQNALLGAIAARYGPEVLGAAGRGVKGVLGRFLGGEIGKGLPAPVAAAEGLAAEPGRPFALTSNAELQQAMRGMEQELSTGEVSPGASSTDAQLAIRDFQAGKISGEDLRTALDVAGGRTPEAPLARPISAGPPGSATPRLGETPLQPPANVPDAEGMVDRDLAATQETMARVQPPKSKATYAYRQAIVDRARGATPEVPAETPDLEGMSVPELMKAKITARGPLREAIDAEMAARRAALTSRIPR